MSLIKSTTSKEIEKLWKNCSVAGKEKEFQELCILCKKQIDSARTVVEKKDFQVKMMESLENLLKGLESHPGLVRVFRSLIKLLRFLLEQKKMMVSVTPAFLENICNCCIFCCKPDRNTWKNKVLIDLILACQAIVGNINCVAENQSLIERTFIGIFSEYPNNPSFFVEPVSKKRWSLEKLDKNNFDIISLLLNVFSSYQQISLQKPLVKEIFSVLPSIMRDTKSSLQNPNPGHILLESQKFIQMINLINTLSQKDRNVLRDFFQNFGEKFKELFVSIISCFNSLATDGGTEAEVSSLFDALLSLFKLTYQEQNKTICNIPMIIFQLLFNTVIPSQSLSFQEEFLIKIKYFSLKFVRTLYCESKFLNDAIIEMMIPQLIFSPQFFSPENHDLDTEWQKIWKFVSSQTNKIKKISSQILEELERNCENLEYLQKFMFWVENLKIESSNVFEGLVKYGIFNVFQGKLKENLDFQVEIALISLLKTVIVQDKIMKFNMINSIKDFFSILHLKNEETLDLYETLIETLLKLCNFRVFDQFLGYLKVCHSNSELKHALNGLERAMINKTSDSLFEKTFTEFLVVEKNNLKLFRILVDLRPFQDPKDLAEVWRSIFSKLFLIISHDSLSFTDNSEFEIFQLLKHLREFPTTKSKIFQEINEQMIEAIFSKTEEIIRFPQLIPVFCESLFENFKLFISDEEKVLKMLKNHRINMELLATHKFFSIFFHYLKRNQDYELFANCQEICFYLISFHFSVYDLENWVDLFTSWNNSKAQNDLLRLLSHGVKYFNIEQTSENFSYFTQSSYYKIDFSHKDLTFGKELNLMFWVYIENYDKCNVAALSIGKEKSIIVTLTKNSVIVRMDEKHHEFTTKLYRNSWIFICINITSRRKATLSHSSRIQVFVDEKVVETSDKFSFSLSNVNKIDQVSIGHNLFAKKDQSYFKGRVSFFAINKKSVDFDLAKELFQQGPDLNWVNTEKSFMRLGKDLKDYFLVDLLNVCHEIRHELHGIYQIRFSSIVQSIQVFGIRNFFMEIRKAIREQEQMNELLDIVRLLVEQDKQNLMIDKECIRFLARVLTKAGIPKNSSEQIPDETCYMIQDILKSLKNEEYFGILFDSIIFSPVLLESFTRKKSSFNFILESFSKTHPFSQENLYIYLKITKHLSFQDFSASFASYIKQVSEAEVKQKLSPIIHRLDNEKQFKQIDFILRSLTGLQFSFSDSEEFLATILKQLSSYYPVEVQLLVLSNIFLGVNSRETYRFEHLFDFIHHYYLDTDLNVVLLKFLLNSGFDRESPLKENRFYFIDIVIQRISHITNEGCKQLLLKKLAKHRQDLEPAVFQRPIYPYWLDKYVSEKGLVKETQEFFDFLFEYGQNIENFTHLEKFFYISRDVQVFKYLVLKYSYDECVNFLIPVHQIMKNCFQQEPETLKEIFKSLRSSQDFFKLVLESFETFEFKEILVSQNPRVSFQKPLIVNYLNFLFFALDTARTHEVDFKYFRRFMKEKHIKYFRTDDPGDEPSKVALFVFVIFQIIQRFLDSPDYFSSEFFYISRLPDVKKNLEFFFEKYLKIIENAVRDDLCLKDKNKVSRESIESDYNDNLSQVKENYLKFLILFDCEDIEEAFLLNKGWIVELVRVINRVFSSFVTSSLSQPRYSQEYLIGLTEENRSFIETIKRKIEELEDNQWFLNQNDKISRFCNKIEQDFQSFKKIHLKLKSTLSSPPAENIKVRQVYDKFYRWSTVKPLKSKSEILNDLKLNQIYSGVSPLVENKDLFFSNQDKTSESPNTTNISETSAVNSREQTGIYANSKPLNSQTFSGYFERIKVQGSYFGKFVISNEMIEFLFEGEEKPPGPDFRGALLFTCQRIVKRRIWFSHEFSEVVLKRFIHRSTALEFVLKSGKSYFCNFFKKKNRAEVLRYLDAWGLKNKVKVSQNELENLMNEWKKGNICNFEYLMILNKWAGRSMNDLSQYPVFPWVITKYETQHFCYDDEKFIRDLKLPIGAQTLASQQSLRSKFSTWKEEAMTPYYYGSHYSNCGIVVHFLLRLEPFTNQAKELQGGNFDVADRLFMSMSCAWDSCSLGIGGDVKELVPELFYNPFIFNNFSQFCFGVTCEGQKIIDVIPPVWAKNNWDFIIKNRNSLESLTVSKEINNWIDLIFGYKQTGKNAEASFNVFTSATYKDQYKKFRKEHEDSDLAAVTEQVYHFGQTPMALFLKKPHVTRDDVGRSFDIFNFFYNNQDHDLDLKIVRKRFSKNGRVNALFIVNEQFVLIRTLGKTTYLNRISMKEGEGNNAFFEAPLNGFLASKESGFVYNNKLFEFSKFYFTWNNNNFAIFNGKLLVAGLDYTNSIKVFDLKGKLVQSLDFHTMTVLCTACTSEVLVSAGLDSRIKLWKFEKDLFSEDLTLNGHNSPVYSLKILESYQLVFSASDQNLLLVHDIKTGLCLQKLDLKVKDMDVNEIGLLAVATEEHLKILGVNFDLVSEKKIFDVVNSVKLSPCGNFCIQAYEHSIYIHDIFDDSKEKLFSECSGFDIQFNLADKNIFIVYNEGTDLHFDLLRFVSTQMILNQKKIIEELV